jgi:hypothetical protein
MLVMRPLALPKLVLERVHKDAGVVGVERDAASGNPRANGAQDAMKGSFGEDVLQGVDGEDEEHGRQRVALAKTPLMAERAASVTIQNHP